MFLWTTYPVQSAIKYLWEMNQNNIYQNLPPDPYSLEILACLERAQAFAFTGDSRLIISTLMTPFCLKKSLLEQGLPSLARTITFNKNLAKYFTIHPDHWPCTKEGEPGIASKRSQVLTYGLPHYLVSPFSFSLSTFPYLFLSSFLSIGVLRSLQNKPCPICNAPRLVSRR